MEPRKIDNRVRYTWDILRKSLLELMAKNPIGTITITALCHQAEINRGTFYKYYADPHDLLAEIQNDLYGEIKTSIGGKSVKGRLPVFEEIFRAIEGSLDVFNVILGENGDKEFMKRLMNVAYEETLSTMRAKYGLDKKSINLVYAFSSSGMAGLIQYWVSGESRMTPREMAEFMDKIVNNGIEGVLGKA